MVRCMGCMKEYDEEYDICPHCGYVKGTRATEVYQLEPESRLKDRYIIGKAVGYGGFGVTYIAWDCQLEVKVAIKEFFPQGVASRERHTTVTVYTQSDSNAFEQGKKRFLKEARSLASFNKIQGIVSIYDYFEENGTAYIVMEYLDGQNLRDYWRDINQNLSLDFVYDVGYKLCDTLSKVHAQNIIHRDISPDNIYLCDDGTIKLIDFGALKQEIEGSQKTTSIIAKQGYAPVEQYYNTDSIGPYTDIYALGATIYYLLTNQVPQSSVERAVKDTLQPPHVINPMVPEGYSLAVMKAMSINWQDRYQNAAEFQAALSDIHAKSSKNNQNNSLMQKSGSQTISSQRTMGDSEIGNDLIEQAVLRAAVTIAQTDYNSWMVFFLIFIIIFYLVTIIAAGYRSYGLMVFGIFFAIPPMVIGYIVNLKKKNSPNNTVFVKSLHQAMQSKQPTPFVYTQDNLQIRDNMIYIEGTEPIVISDIILISNLSEMKSTRNGAALGGAVGGIVGAAVGTAISSAANSLKKMQTIYIYTITGRTVYVKIYKEQLMMVCQMLFNNSPYSRMCKDEKKDINYVNTARKFYQEMQKPNYIPKAPITDHPLTKGKKLALVISGASMVLLLFIVALISGIVYNIKVQQLTKETEDIFANIETDINTEENNKIQEYVDEHEDIEYGELTQIYIPDNFINNIDFYNMDEPDLDEQTALVISNQLEMLERMGGSSGELLGKDSQTISDYDIVAQTEEEYMYILNLKNQCSDMKYDIMATTEDGAVDSIWAFIPVGKNTDSEEYMMKSVEQIVWFYASKYGIPDVIEDDNGYELVWSITLNQQYTDLFLIQGVYSASDIAKVYEEYGYDYGFEQDDVVCFVSYEHIDIDDMTSDNTESSSDSNLEQDSIVCSLSDGILLVNHSLMGQTYDNVKRYIESNGYEFSLAQPMEWDYWNMSNTTANWIDLNDEQTYGFYFQNDTLIGISYEDKARKIDIADLVSVSMDMFSAIMTRQRRNDGSTVYCWSYQPENKYVNGKNSGLFYIFNNQYDNIDSIVQIYISDKFNGDVKF